MRVAASQKNLLKMTPKQLSLARHRNRSKTLAMARQQPFSVDKIIKTKKACLAVYRLDGELIDR
jgi:hypothetical protein